MSVKNDFVVSCELNDAIGTVYVIHLSFTKKGFPIYQFSNNPEKALKVTREIAERIESDILAEIGNAQIEEAVLLGERYE